jgi:hypothetical protein
MFHYPLSSTTLKWHRVVLTAPVFSMTVYTVDDFENTIQFLSFPHQKPRIDRTRSTGSSKSWSSLSRSSYSIGTLQSDFVSSEDTKLRSS